MFNSHIDIINPGELLRPLKISEILKDDHIPKSRNKILVGVLSNSGIKRMEEICREENAPIPEIDVQENYFYVTFRPNPEYLKMASKKTEEPVGETIQKILQLIKKNPKITREILSEKIGLSVRGVEWNLMKLKQKGLLKRVGSTKSGHWEAVK